MTHPVSLTPFALAVLLGLAWASGTLFGFALHTLPAIGAPRARAARKGRRRHRTGGYYFSDDAGSWGDRRWRVWLAWGTATVVAVILIGSGVIAAQNWKARPNAAAGYRG